MTQGRPQTYTSPPPQQLKIGSGRRRVPTAILPPPGANVGRAPASLSDPKFSQQQPGQQALYRANAPADAGSQKSRPEQELASPAWSGFSWGPRQCAASRF